MTCLFSAEPRAGEGFPSFLEFDEPEAFVKFLVRATTMRSSKEYRQFYSHLLHCFTAADHRKVGAIDFEGFDSLIEVATGAPRKLGFAPAAINSGMSAEEHEKSRRMQFNDMDVTKSGSISFDEFLFWTLAHVRNKIAASKAEFAPSDVVYPAALDDVASAPLYDRERTTQSEFVGFLQKAMGDKQSKEYKILYYHLLRCFTEADVDLTGRISFDDFDVLIEAASAAPRHFGFDLASDMILSSSQERSKARESLFQEMSKGFLEISFHDFLAWTVAHIQEKIASSH